MEIRTLKLTDFDKETQEKIKYVMEAFKRSLRVVETRRNLIRAVAQREAQIDQALKHNAALEEAKKSEDADLIPRLPPPMVVPEPYPVPAIYYQSTPEEIAIKFVTEGAEAVIEVEKLHQLQDAQAIILKADGEKAQAEALIEKINSAKEVSNI